MEQQIVTHPPGFEKIHHVKPRSLLLHRQARRYCDRRYTNPTAPLPSTPAALNKMDVSQWVQETIDSHPAPVHGVEHADVVFSSDRYELDGAERRCDKGHRKRKLPSSDSSILDPGRPSHTAPPKRAARLIKARRSRSIASSFQSYIDAASRSSCNHSATDPYNAYQRRSRHKTRPDRYEVKPKRSKRRDEAKARKVKPKQRTHRRRADGDDTNHLVQSFEPQAGTRQSRLTVCALGGRHLPPANVAELLD